MVYSMLVSPKVFSQCFLTVHTNN